MILAIDQGTTGTTCLVVDERLRVRGRGYRELPQHFPRPGWVEHDPEEIHAGVLAAAEAALTDAGVGADALAAVGIANQRETTILWERASGRPVAPAIVWQDRRTAAALPGAPGRTAARAHGARPGSVLLGDEARVAARPHGPAAGGSGLRDGRRLARVATRRRARDRPDERVADAALRTRGLRLGRRAARPLRRPARRAPARRRLGRGHRRGRAPRRDRAARRARGRPAGGARRARLLHGRRGEGDLRHRELRPRARGRRAPGTSVRPLATAAAAAPDGLRAGGRGPHRAARPCSGSATGSASSAPRRRRRRWRGASTDRRASSSSRH